MTANAIKETATGCVSTSATARPRRREHPQGQYYRRPCPTGWPVMPINSIGDDVAGNAVVQNLRNFPRRRAADWFRLGSSDTKRLILKTVGSNLALTDKKLNIEARKPFQRLAKAHDFPKRCGVIEDVRTFLEDGHMPMILANIRLLRDQMENRSELVNKAA